MVANIDNEIMSILAYILVFIFCIIIAELLSRLLFKNGDDDE